MTQGTFSMCGYFSLQIAEDEFKAKGKDVTVEHNPNGLIAVQGPTMNKALQLGVDIDLSKLTFMTTIRATVFGVENCRITRCGYTGEDGVEVKPSTCKHVKVCSGRTCGYRFSPISR